MSRAASVNDSEPVKDVAAFEPVKRSWFYNTLTQALIIGAGESYLYRAFSISLMFLSRVSWPWDVQRSGKLLVTTGL